MTWLITAKQYIPAVIGEAFGGGYFAGYISHTADGNPTHALIVAPKAEGATGTGYTVSTNYAWKTSNTTTTSADSSYDGAGNTAAMVSAGISDHPAAQFCTQLTIAGFSDWYLPSRLELEIAYFNLKPTTALNNTSFGINSYAVPPRSSNYTLIYPSQTLLTLFNTSSEAFAAQRHWSSTDYSSSVAYDNNFVTGQISIGSGASKTTPLPVRAFRRIAL
jgi:hypothetical protein